MTAAPVLAIEGLEKRFGAVLAVAGVDLAVAEGEFVSLLGPSGCGKTTILRCIAGFEQPDRGHVRLAGAVVDRLPPERRDIGMVFQSYALFPNMTVAGNIAFPMMLRGMPPAERARRVEALLEVVQLPGYGERRISELSGGQRQRVALARALAKEPRLLLLDEPLSALDAKIREELRVEIRHIQKELGITALYVTHDQEEALAISDRVVVMNAGRIEQVGSPIEIYRRPATLFVAGFVGTMNFFEGLVLEGRFRWREHPLVHHGAAAFRDGDAAVLCLRPEEMRAAPAGEDLDLANRLEGVAGPTTFLGSVARLRVLLAGDRPVDIDMPATEVGRFPMGEAVTIGFSAEAGLLLPAGREDAGGGAVARLAPAHSGEATSGRGTTEEARREAS